MAQCTAHSKRSGERCKNVPVEGYNVCRMHGANNFGAGAPLGNKNGLKTGLKEHIAFDTLTDDERALVNEISTDPLEQLINEIKLCEIRERRMMQRIAKLAGLSFIDVSEIKHAGKEVMGRSDWKETHSEATTIMINRIESSLSTVQARKQRLIGLLFQRMTDTDSGAIDRLAEIFGEIRDIRKARGVNGDV